MRYKNNIKFALFGIMKMCEKNIIALKCIHSEKMKRNWYRIDMSGWIINEISLSMPHTHTQTLIKYICISACIFMSFCDFIAPHATFVLPISSILITMWNVWVCMCACDVELWDARSWLNQHFCGIARNKAHAYEWQNRRLMCAIKCVCVDGWNKINK
jgi:hypothetical protein